MAGTLWPALVAGQKARASDVEAKFDWLEGSLAPMSGGNMTTGVYDLGTSTAAWKYIHVWPTGGIMCSGATSLSFMGDGSIKLKNGSGVNEFSTDGTLAGNSDDALPTEKAVKSYVALVAGHAPGSVFNSSDVTSYFNNTSTTLALALFYGDQINFDLDSKFTTTTYVGFTVTASMVTATFGSVTSKQIRYKIDTGAAYAVSWKGTSNHTGLQRLFISAGNDAQIIGTLDYPNALTLYHPATTGSYAFSFGGLIYASSANSGYIRIGAVGGPINAGTSWGIYTQFEIHRVT